MIDSRAIIEPGARLGENVSVGPFSIVGGDVTIGDGSWIGPHVVISGRTTIGKDNKVFQFTSVGEAPQHVGYQGEDTQVEIGDRNVIREYCTINRGTPVGTGRTRISDDNFLMAYVHIAHDCQLGSHIIFANSASIAGHVTVGDYVVLGGFSLVHQFCRVGTHSIVGAGSLCMQDIPPYLIAAGNRAATHGINVKGLQRREFPESVIRQLKRAYKIVYRSGATLNEALATLAGDAGMCSEVRDFAEFFRYSKRGVMR